MKVNRLIFSIIDNGFILTITKVFNYFYNKIKFNTTRLKYKFIKRFTSGDLIVRHGKHKFIYYNSGDRSECLYHAFWNRYYNEEYDKIKNHIQVGDTVIDVGGNLGFYTLILSELVGTSGKVYTFEPSKENFRKLNKTISINELKNVSSFNLGLGENETKTKLYYDPHQTGVSTIIGKRSSGVETEEILLTTLDSFTKDLKEKISFIKIDTEGYEPQVLKGSKKLLLKDRPVICIELGREYVDSSLEALKILRDCNYNSDSFHINLNDVPSGTNFIFKSKQLN